MKKNKIKKTEKRRKKLVLLCLRIQLEQEGRCDAPYAFYDNSDDGTGLEIRVVEGGLSALNGNKENYYICFTPFNKVEYKRCKKRLKQLITSIEEGKYNK